MTTPETYSASPPVDQVRRHLEQVEAHSRREPGPALIQLEKRQGAPQDPQGDPQDPGSPALSQPEAQEIGPQSRRQQNSQPKQGPLPGKGVKQDASQDQNIFPPRGGDNIIDCQEHRQEDAQKADTVELQAELHGISAYLSLSRTAGQARR